MAIKVAGITRDELDQNALWVVRHESGYRKVGTYPDLDAGGYLDDDDIKDVDLLCKEGQPDIIKPFMDEMDRLSNEYGWMTIPEIFEKFGVEESEVVCASN